MSMDYGSMSEREAIDHLDTIYDAIEEGWNHRPDQARYLEAIDHAQDSLRDEIHTQENTA